MGELPTPMAEHGLIGTTVEETPNWSLVVLASKLDGVGQALVTSRTTG